MALASEQRVARVDPREEPAPATAQGVKRGGPRGAASAAPRETPRRLLQEQEATVEVREEELRGGPSPARGKAPVTRAPAPAREAEGAEPPGGLSPQRKAP